jgi:hypothetical protein
VELRSKKKNAILKEKREKIEEDEITKLRERGIISDIMKKDFNKRTETERLIINKVMMVENRISDKEKKRLLHEEK